MAILKILHYPDPILKKVSEPVEVFDEELKTLVEDMAETMYAAPGVGLAAPQIGINKRLTVLDCAPKDGPSNLIAVVNPEIVEREGECFEEEGCLSVPEYWARVKRAEWVKVRYLDVEGKTQEIETDGLLAIALQHEIDHLDGILFVDHLSSLKKNMFQKKYKKMMERQEQQ